MAANVTGQWGSLLTWPIIGIHSIVTQDGKVLSFGTDQSGTQGAMMYHDLWDPATGTHTTINHQMTTATDIFCANGIVIPGTDKILISGGDARPLGNVNHGVADVNVFNTTTNQMTPDTHGTMAYARWYSTAINLTDGRILELGGSNASGVGVSTPEVYTPGEGWKTLTGATDASAAASYDRAFVNKDGKVVYFGTSGGSNTAVMLLDTAGNGSVQKIGTLPFTYDWQSPAIQFAPGKILINDSTTGLWTMDINSATPTFSKVGDIGKNREYANMTVLADGKVMINGGSTSTNVDTTAVKTALIFDPSTNVLKATVDEVSPRLYHSTSVLLTDGTVLSMGGGSLAGPSATLANQLNAQIYKPPYLFDASGNEATRPRILGTPDHMQSGTTFTITVDNAADIQKLTFVKNGATTHDFNMDAAAVTLNFTVGANNTLIVTLPDYHGGVTAGSWMLFAWNKAGVPSIAPVLEVDPVFNTGGVIDAANMLTNGSFETASTFTGGKVFDDMVGWHSSKNNFELWRSGFNGVNASDGATSIEIDAERGSVWQGIHTKTGQVYDISFDFIARAGMIATSKMDVLWNGFVIGTVTPADLLSHHIAFSVTGTGGKDILSFQAVNGDTDTIGGLLDNVVFKEAADEDHDGNHIMGTAVHDYLVGTDANDHIQAGDGNDTLVGGKGNDFLDGQGGDYNQADYEGKASDYVFTKNADGTIKVVNAVYGTDTLQNINGVWFYGENKWYSINDLIQTTTTGTTTITATAAGGYLDGTSGNDQFIGGAGVDVFHGGKGNDTYDGAGGGYNQVDFDGVRADYTFTRNADGTITAKHPVYGTDTLKSIDGAWFMGEAKWYSTTQLVTDSGKTIINATDAGGWLNGTDGNDGFYGAAGNDTFHGGKGNDTYDGGSAGYDQVDFDGHRADYTFTHNADGTITATHADFGTDILTNIDGAWFYGDNAWASTAQL